MEQVWNTPRIVIGAPHGHSGKTTISIGLLGALRKNGHEVQPFKKGPDYIDPSWLGHAAGRFCRNLDCFWMNERQILNAVVHGSTGADMVLIEGAMGLFDGVDLEGTGSTAQIARITKSPVVLVVDATRMTRSIAPIILGCMNFEPDIRIAGVILNKVARSRHEEMLKAAVEKYCGIPVLGAIPKNAYSVFPERHLGLVPAAEHDSVLAAIAGNIAIAEQYLDLAGIATIAGTALPIAADTVGEACQIGPVVRIGIIRDQSFTFYYPENIEALACAGAELIYIDSMRDETLPPLDGLYIGGGFPEIFGKAIAANAPLRSAVKVAADGGLPIYAECGGLMYLARTIRWHGDEFPMCGVLPLDVIVENRPQGHGYTVMRSLKGNPFFAEDRCVKGHEFHHSRVINVADGMRYSYQVVRGQGIDGQQDGLLYKNVFATYNHIHATANPEWAPRFVALAHSFRQRN
ncbi:MAG: hydrogenobyrinic acid a,c-diamide synthase (glutamine-hydrolyzing) [Negativicutes bacterium]|nr:hydrogenobyrinic acid a,c-diamide synthase (glutamine-hydrolyzing) [Negativicutes bacterium]